MDELSNELGAVLYKQDSKGKIRTFQMEVSGGSYRTITGLIDGAKITTAWTECKPKNVGRSNATTPEEQAIAEVAAKYTKKIAIEHYSYDIEEVTITRHKYFSPMLAETAKDAKWEMEEGVEVIIDPKLDGMRMVTQPKIAHSRKGKPIAASVEILANLGGFFEQYPTVTLDGELYNHEYHANFQTLMKLFRKEKPNQAELGEMLSVAEYHVYDMFDEANPDLTAKERKAWLVEHLQSLSIDKVFVIPGTIVNTIVDYKWGLDKNLEDGYEGSIIRIPFARYVNKRAKSLLKIKIFDDDEFIIKAILPGKGNRSSMAGSIVVDVYGALVGCGIRGDKSYFEDLLDRADDYVGLKATVRFFGFTDDGKLRFPVVVDINRPD